MTPLTFEIGLNSFGEVATDDGRTLSDAETVRLLVQEAALAESSGLDVFSVGEHYRPGHVGSATPVLLSAIAAVTERIRLGTSVTVLSTNDPVRLHHDFATLDAVSNGRAQLVLGRARPRSPSLSSATNSPTTRSCSRRSSNCSCVYGGRRRCPGPARSGDRSWNSGCVPGCAREASPPGSAWAAALTPCSVPPAADSP